MKKEIREQLIQMAEPEYQRFAVGLIPGEDKMLGIRIPQLRALAKQIVKSDWKAAIKEQDVYFEETMLHGMILSYASKDMDEMLPYIKEFIPRVNNWSVCDSVFMGMHIFQTDRKKTWKFIEAYLHSDKEFEIRVALIIMMQHLLKCDRQGKKTARLRVVGIDDLRVETREKGLYVDKVFEELDMVKTADYYASMAASWLLAEAFCCYPYNTYQYILENHLDDITHNKGIQKITESKIPTNEVKSILKSSKRRN